MRDIRQPPQPPHDWHAAFAALPPEAPPPGGWDGIASRLDRPRHVRGAWFAAAAAAALAVAAFVPGPWAPVPSDPVAATPPHAPATDALARLHAESQALETVLAAARDERVATGTAAALAGEFDARIARIDAELSRSDLAPAQQSRLWRARVDLLRSAAGFEGTRRWLAAHGRRYDAALVQLD